MSVTGGYMHDVDWVNAFLCLPMLMLLHASGNLLSDYSDYIHGVDGPDCINGVTWIRSGLFSPDSIRKYGRALLAAGAAIGLVLLLRTSFSAIWLGIAGLLIPLLYFYFKGRALGDVDILLGFALLPTVGTVYVATGSWHPEMLLLCLPFGLHIVAILHANNTRDIASDRRAGLTTLAGKAGYRASQFIYAAEIFLPYLLIAAFCIFADMPFTLMLAWLSLPIAVENIRIMFSPRGREDERFRFLDQKTARFQMIFGLLYSFGFILGAIAGV